MSQPLVTIVVVPRERFSKTQSCIESLIACTQIPYRMVVVDGGSYRSVRNWLRDASARHGFELIRVNHFLSPNRARNIGLQHVTTKYVVFVDNDVIATPGWLKAMVDCAEQTGADAVTPVTCQGEPVHTEIHCTVGSVSIREVDKAGRVERHIYDCNEHQGRPIADMQSGYTRCPTTFVEFHCVFCRRDLFDRIGPFDEGMLNTREHIDLCLSIQKAGGTIYFEPASLVTYLLATELTPGDIPFYRLRWSEEWQRASLYHLRDKWQLEEDGYFKVRLGRLEWRRRESIVKPLLARHPLLAKLPRSFRLLDRYHHHMAERAARKYYRLTGVS